MKTQSVRQGRTVEGTRLFWFRFSKNRAAVVGLILVLLLTVVAVFAPIIAPYSYIDTGAGPRMTPPDSHNLFGTDEIGRDVYSSVIWGSRVSLFVGIAAAAISTLFGALIGAIAGYYGRIVDDLLMRLTEIFQVIPTFILAIVILAFFGSTLINVVFVISALVWPGSARIVRAEFLRLKEMEFVESARSIGAGDRHIIFSEILPNAFGLMIVNATLVVGFSILLAAGLSFVGLGDVNHPDWGFMLQRSMQFITEAWWLTVFPGLAIFITVLAFNLLGEGLTYALNPKLETTSA